MSASLMPRAWRWTLLASVISHVRPSVVGDIAAAPSSPLISLTQIVCQPSVGPQALPLSHSQQGSGVIACFQRTRRIRGGDSCMFSSKHSRIGQQLQTKGPIACRRIYPCLAGPRHYIETPHGQYWAYWLDDPRARSKMEVTVFGC